MKTAICTIITQNYLPVANTLYKSVKKNGNDFSFFAFITDKNEIDTLNQEIKIIEAKDLLQSETAKAIYDKYSHINNDVLRWALKPILICHLLNSGYSKVLFMDPDIYFISSFDFLLQELETCSIIITPHWADRNIISNPDSLLSVLRNGLFNAGFIGASQEGLTAMEWWATACLYSMKKGFESGTYDDQKYLDYLQVEFDNVRIIRHRGCNLASWNIHSNKRELINGRLKINKYYEPVFIHFTKETIVNILNKNDCLLRPYLDEYVQKLNEYGFDLLSTIQELPRVYDTIYYKTKHRLRLRTRLKSFLYRLAEKL